MYGIYLSKTGKEVFRLISDDGMDDSIRKMPNYAATLKYLEYLGLIEILILHGEINTVALTDLGVKFKTENPKLKNDMTENNKWKITTAIAVVALILSVIGTQNIQNAAAKIIK